MSDPFPYRLAAIDIDDTLAGPDKAIGDANRLAVDRLRDAGCRVVLASGRRHGNMLRYAQSLGIDDFVISAQGALTRHASRDDVIHHAPLDRTLAGETVELGRQMGVGLVMFTPGGAFSAAPTDWTEKLKRDTGGDLVYVDRLPPSPADVVEKVLWCDEPDRLAGMFESMTARFEGRAIVTITDPHLLEYTSPDATKAAGLAAVAKHYGIAQAQTLAFGDGNNDVPMLGWAGLGIAMSHASENAKRAAKRVAPPGNPETSLARAVEALLGG
ncbi:Cof-type HAD-IIB family hydrolase [Humisphaera borealis]|uniref:HAD family phosphatase n=1 Tax=Humisphaera borealis TaxID=2807512 RepID=A0A7M2WP33_9BACT|nr:Cof-type HAD-IIB family hydrolase [Humisphaera borealis]QOV87297.1 HAD family phosphatase [Humisphaera borealis]